MDVFVYETTMLIDQLEATVMGVERSKAFNDLHLNEISHIIHNIKSISTTMLYGSISSIADKVALLLSRLADISPNNYNYMAIVDYILDVSDYMKEELIKISKGIEPSGNYEVYLNKADNILLEASNKESQPTREYHYKATIFFEENCGLEHLRAFSLVHGLREIARDIKTIHPKDCEEEENCTIIKEEGVTVEFLSQAEPKDIQSFLKEVACLKHLNLTCLGFI